MSCPYEIFLIIVLAVFTLFIWHCRTFLKEKAKEYSSGVFQRYLIIAENVIETTVIRLNEKVVNKIKELSKDGKLTRDEADAILEEAVNTIKTILGEYFIDIISDHIGDFDSWILQQIEKYVSLNKLPEHDPKDLYEKLDKKDLVS